MEVTTRVLVAGIGNIFFSDDGFGPEVVRRMLSAPEDVAPLPEGVRLVDYGIRGMHLAYDLLDGVDALVIVDALPGDGVPGTITVLEVGPEDLGEGEFDAHGMNPVAVLGSLDALGGSLPPTFVVGCTPADLEEGMGLSPAVAAAVDVAADTVRSLLFERVLSIESEHSQQGG
ncbi:MAG: hydrogenase maturation protease [Actinomycetota bacterium]|nr:hydrogenase maturation protease [Actinomycetota bacterium]